MLKSQPKTLSCPMTLAIAIGIIGVCLLVVLFIQRMVNDPDTPTATPILTEDQVTLPPLPPLILTPLSPDLVPSLALVPTQIPFVMPQASATIATLSPTSTLYIPINQADFTCNCSKLCSALTCDEAYFQLNACGCGRRDGDSDGIPCENVCGG